MQYLEKPPESNNLIQLEVGIEDSVHLKFRSSKSEYLDTFIIS